MRYKIYKASKREGGRKGVAPGSRRVNVTLPVSVFEILRDRADRNRRGIGGEAGEILCEILEAEIVDAAVVSAGNA